MNTEKLAHQLAQKTHGYKAHHFAEMLPKSWSGLAVNLAIEHRRQRRLSTKRFRRRHWTDPLILARNSRVSRTPSAIEAAKAKEVARQAVTLARLDKINAELAEKKAIRDSLIRAARVARSEGFRVRASKGNDGKISSYYITRGSGSMIRISDHEIPWTAQRDNVARFNGRPGYDGFYGAELIIDRPRSNTWIRRAITLVEAGRIALFYR